MVRDSSPVTTIGDVQELVDGNTTFALDLYHQLAGGSEDNLFFSPFSISLALAMVHAGAAGKTEQQMADAMNFHLPQERLHPAFNALDQYLASCSSGEGDDGFTLHSANALWGQEGHGFLTTYLDILARNYGGQVREVDFRTCPEDARQQINCWVSEATAKRIEDLIDPGAIVCSSRLVLANAVYFKAKWDLPFEEEDSRPGHFSCLNGEQVEVPMMRQTGLMKHFNYSQGDGFQAVALDYKERSIAMTLLVPDAGRYDEFETSLDNDLFQTILQDMETQRVNLTMPKFKLETSLVLRDSLVDMGMPNAFDRSKAEFQGMDGQSCLAGDDECLSISNVIHKAFVAVDEAGTEAAAATAVMMMGASAVPESPIELVVDRPFIFLIHDRNTGAILFLGRVANPSSRAH